MSGKPTVFNYQDHLRALEQIERLKNDLHNMSIKLRIESTPAQWVELDESGVYCTNCQSFFYYDENLKRGEKLFRFCPDCGQPMEAK